MAPVRILRIQFIDNMAEPVKGTGNVFNIDFTGTGSVMPAGQQSNLVTYYILPSGQYLHFVGKDFIVCEQMDRPQEFIRDIVCFCSSVSIAAVKPSEIPAFPQDISSKISLPSDDSVSFDISDVQADCAKYRENLDLDNVLLEHYPQEQVNDRPEEISPMDIVD